MRHRFRRPGGVPVEAVGNVACVEEVAVRADRLLRSNLDVAKVQRMLRLAVLVLAGSIAFAHGAAAGVISKSAASDNVRATISYSIPGDGYFVVRLVVERAGKRVLAVRVPPYSRDLAYMRSVGK